MYKIEGKGYLIEPLQAFTPDNLSSIGDAISSIGYADLEGNFLAVSSETHQSEGNNIVIFS